MIMIDIDMHMPDNCDECRFNTEYGFCKAMPDNFCGNTDNRKRPEWCPMKEKEIRWIPVTEKLPELNQRVLVYAIGKIDGFIGEHVIEICSRFVQRFLPSSPGYETWSSPYQYFHTDYEITHWMPLPEPPRENDNGR